MSINSLTVKKSVGCVSISLSLRCSLHEYLQYLEVILHLSGNTVRFLIYNTSETQDNIFLTKKCLFPKLTLLIIVISIYEKFSGLAKIKSVLVNKVSTANLLKALRKMSNCSKLRFSINIRYRFYWFGRVFFFSERWITTMINLWHDYKCVPKSRKSGVICLFS